MNDCHVFIRVIDSLATIAGCLTNSLFLFKIHAVYHDRKSIKIIFVLLWLISTLGLITVLLFHKGTLLEPGTLCIIESTGPLGNVPVLATPIFTFSASVAISYRVSYYPGNRDKWVAFRAFFTAESAGPLSKALMRAEQQYAMCVYLIIQLDSAVSNTGEVPCFSWQGAFW